MGARRLADRARKAMRPLRRLVPSLRRQWRLLLLATLALGADVAFRMLEPWPLTFVIDHVLVPRSSAPPAWLAPWVQDSPPTLVAVAALAVVLVAIARAIGGYYSAVGFSLAGNHLLSDVRAALFSHLQRLSLSFHARAGSGDLVMRVVGDVNMLKDVTTSALLPLVANLALLVGMVAVMLRLHWQLGLLAAGIIPLFALSTIRFGRKIRQVSREQRVREGAMAARTAESLGGIRTIRALSIEHLWDDRFARQNHGSIAEGARAKRLEAGLERTVDVLVAVATGGVLWFGTHLVQEAALTPGELLVFLAYLKNAFKPVRDFAKYTGRLAKGGAAAERVFDLLDTVPDVVDAPDAQPLALTGALRFEHVTFGYEPGHPVLRDIDLEIPAGQRVAIVGPSGSGKSTVTALVPRFYDPQQGRLLVDGVDVRACTLSSLRSQVTTVLQESLLFAVSIRENIAYGAPGATHEQIRAAAALADAHGFIERLPQGYDTVVGERGTTLSAGQRQRIAIARAAMRRAPIVILDEPTTGLDEESEQAVTAALDRLTRGCTTLLITHDLYLAMMADRVIVIEAGVVRESGTPAALLEAGGRFAQLLALESGRGRPEGREEVANAAG